MLWLEGWRKLTALRIGNLIRGFLVYARSQV